MLQLTRTNAAWLICYLTLLGVLALALRQARQQVLSELGTDQAQADWQAWQAEAARQSQGEGPVARRVPKSGEPPELVLLRDHFAVSFVGLAILTTALFLTAMVLVRGFFGGREFEMTRDAESS